MPGFLEPIWEAVFRFATWTALIFGALSIGSAFVSAWVGWEITDATQKAADGRIKAADERIAEYNARAKEAELKLEQLRKHLQPRKLNEEIFLAPLKGWPPQKYKILYERQASDASSVSRDLMLAFGKVGWVTTDNPIPIEDSPFPAIPGITGSPPGSAASIGAAVFGITVFVKNPDSPLANALNAAFLAEFDESTIVPREGLADDTAVIVIAPRM